MMAEILLLDELTDAELYHAALFARACLVIRAAACDDLLSADFDDVDLERCEEVVAYAVHQGVELSADAVDAVLAHCLARSDP